MLQSSSDLLSSQEGTEDSNVLVLTPSNHSGSGRFSCNAFHLLLANVRRFGWRRLFTVAIFFLINFFNYVDRFICASLLEDLQKQFGIQDDLAGLLQTCFFASYMLAAPLFGYLGDRRSRVRLMAIGLVIWAIISGCAAAVPTNLFPVFLLLRALIGIGEASYATLCPTVISDIFSGQTRTMVYLIYSVAVPLGSGAAYIIAPAVASAFGSWRYSFLVVPIAVLVLALLLILVVHEPIRGQADGLSNLKATSVKDDLLYLINVKSFVFVTLGFVGLAFCLGAISYWCPIFFDRAYLVAGKGTPSISPNSITFIFGAITVSAGIGGVVIGTVAAYALRKRFGDSVDAAICGIGMLLAAPAVFCVLLTIIPQATIAWLLTFVAVMLLSLNWVLVIDVTMYTIVPTRRSSAAAVQMFCGHLLGDAASPWIIGELSTRLAPTTGVVSQDLASFLGLQSSLFVMPFVLTIGALAFLFCSLYCSEDHQRAAEGDIGASAVHNQPSGIENDTVSFSD